MSKRMISQVVGAAVFAVLTLVAIAVFLGVFAPKAYEQKTQPFAAYDSGPMQKAVAAANVRAELERIAGFGSRFLGQEGARRTAEYVRERFEKAGLHVMVQVVDTAAPETQYARLLSADGRVLPDKLYPFLPNHFQPMVTPPGGLSGELLLLSEDVMLKRRDFRDTIGILDCSKPAIKGYGYDWVKYAQMGIQAVIVTRPDGLDKVKWSELAGMVSDNPVNYVRLAADPEIMARAGQRVRLDVRTAYRNTPNTTVIGKLKGRGQAREAVVVAGYYDTSSYLPDRALSVMQALPTAVQLGLLDGLVPYRDQLRRDVIFVSFGSKVMAMDGINQFLRAAGEKTDPEPRRVELEEEKAANAASLALVEAVRPICDADGFLTDAARTARLIEGLTEPQRAFFHEQARYVLNSFVFSLSEDLLRTKIAFYKDPARDLAGEPYRKYQEAKKRYDDAFSCAGYSVQKLTSERKEFIRDYNVRTRLVARLDELLAFHQRRAAQIEQNIAVHRLLAAYRSIVVVAPELATYEKAGVERLSFGMGSVDHLEQAQNMKDVVMASIRRLKLDSKVRLDFTGRKHNRFTQNQIKGVPLLSELFSSSSYPAFSFFSPQADYEKYAYPAALPEHFEVGTIENSLKVVGESVLSLAFGNGEFPALKVAANPLSFYGRVLVSNVGQSIIPNYPLEGALVGCKGWKADRGFFPQLLFFTDVYGWYDYKHCIAPFIPAGSEYSPNTVGFDGTGLIAYMKDEGLAAQSLYKSSGFKLHLLNHPVNIVVFRASPVSILDLINPQTMKSYSGAELIRSRSLDAFGSFNTFLSSGIVTSFVRPDEYFFVKLKAGSPENELVQTTRAFMLGTDIQAVENQAQQIERLRPGREIQGDGYLALDSELLLGTPFEVAKSMVFVNGERLALERRHHMADERTIEFHEKSTKLIEEAVRPDQSEHKAILLARDSVTYATLNHPVLRAKIFEAVAGIIWYLGLLAPFVFFFEKLVFGYTDIRKQLGAQLIIFLIVFGLLKMLHPAFEMIRSSLMILLGFIIFMFSLGIAALFTGKFKENLEDIRKQRGQVSAAEVNRMGVVATAFMLGLNNMHRRRVRTGLTCGTLILLTFVMICFTSVHSNIVDTQTAVGKASYQGFLIKNERFRPVSGAELFALQTKYGDANAVVPRQIYVGTEDWTTRERINPQLEMLYEPPGAPAQAFPFESLIQFDADEPLRSKIRFLTHRGWFTRDQIERADLDVLPVMIPETAAAKLGITPRMVDAGDVYAMLNGKKFLIQGIFDPASLGQLTDLDGKGLLPFDVTALRTINKDGNVLIIADDTDPKISPDNILLAPYRSSLGITIDSGYPRIYSVAVVLPEEMKYKEARAIIDGYLEQSGKSTYYGLDGYSFLGQRARKSTLAGVIDMLIPLIIAFLTVLNTMKGSVYERKEEIFVYNAVGIAPRYIFFMFIAEAFVYAVVGSVLGYLLSQGVGRVLTELGYTGGLNMTFTSKTTIYASLTIALSVFLSTYYPARQAMRIAAPTEDVGWTLPEPEGDRLSFSLPFTFDYRDRIAILSFFNKYFIEHGVGSSGPFYAGEPSFDVSDALDAAAGDAYVPRISVTIWLKPFDLGVCQRLEISLPTDPETREYIANIALVRQSGTLENWKRLNYHFVSLIRKHFLYWRAVSPAERQVMFEEARALLETGTREKETAHA